MNLQSNERQSCFASENCCHFSFLFYFGCILMSTCCTSLSHFVLKIQTTTTYQHIPHHTITHSTHTAHFFSGCVLQDSRLIADRFFWRRIFQVSDRSACPHSVCHSFCALWCQRFNSLEVAITKFVVGFLPRAHFSIFSPKMHLLLHCAERYSRDPFP